MVQHAPSRFTVLLPNEQGAWNHTVTRLLEPQGVHTVMAHTGREALGIIESTPIHAVVLDTQMPQLGGLQVIKIMRERQLTPPTILLTAKLSSALLRDALGMSVFSVLSKPVDYALLLDALARVLKRYHENKWPT